MRAPLMFATGAGQHDTHALTITGKDGHERPNPSPSAGQPYAGITGKAIVELIRNPPSVPKEKAQWFIPSTYLGHDARRHEAQRQKARSGGCRWM